MRQKLGLKPRLKLDLNGAVTACPPEPDATLTARPVNANIGLRPGKLPKAAFLDNAQSARSAPGPISQPTSARKA